MLDVRSDEANEHFGEGEPSECSAERTAEKEGLVSLTAELAKQTGLVTSRG